MAEKNMTIRRIRQLDRDGVIELRRSYGQQMGIGALDSLMKCDPDGIYVAVTEDGQVQGTVAVIDMCADLSCVMLHTVRAEHQKSGLASRLWREAVEPRLGTDKNAFLICGAFHVAMYFRRFGFEVVSTECIHYIRPGAAVISSLPRSVEGVDVSRLPAPPSAEDDADATASAIVDYDASVFGFRRERFLRPLLAEPGNVVVVARRGNDSQALAGYGVVSTDISGCALLRIVYADDGAIAECIVFHLLESYEPFRNKGLTGLLLAGAGEGRGLDHKMSLETAPYVNILYRRHEPATCDYKRQFVVPV